MNEKNLFIKDVEGGRWAEWGRMGKMTKKISCKKTIRRRDRFLRPLLAAEMDV